MQQSDTVQSDVDVKRTTKNTPEDKHWRRYHLGEEEEKTEAEMDGLYQSRKLSGQPKMKSVTTIIINIKWEWVDEENCIVLI